VREAGVDCPGSGPGPRGPGSGPDRTYRSECPGQREGGPALCSGVQVQEFDGPDLRFRTGPNPNRTHFFQ
jgi:hypothetical protein